MVTIFSSYFFSSLTKVIKIDEPKKMNEITKPKRWYAFKDSAGRYMANVANKHFVTWDSQILKRIWEAMEFTL